MAGVIPSLGNAPCLWLLDHKYEIRRLWPVRLGCESSWGMKSLHCCFSSTQLSTVRDSTWWKASSRGQRPPGPGPAQLVAAALAVDLSSEAAPHLAGCQHRECEQAGGQQASQLCYLHERHLLQSLCHSVAVMWKGNWILLKNWTLWKHLLPWLSNAFSQTENLTLQ